MTGQTASHIQSVAFDARFWLDVVQWATTIGVGLYVWASSRHRATRTQIDKLRDRHDSRLDNHGDRLTRAEEQLRHLPTSDALAELTGKVNELHGDMKALDAKFEGFKEMGTMIRRQVEMMDSFLRNQSG